MADIQVILRELDVLFSEGDVKRIQQFLETKTQEAKENKEADNHITLLNEMIGFCRDMGQFDKGEEYAGELYQLVDKEPYKNTPAYATTLLNIANFKRAKGDFKKSEELYLAVLPIYETYVDKKDFRYASYYNNLSLLYQEMKAYEKAVECLKKALFIAKTYEEARIEVATTYTNMANCYLKLNDLDKAEECIREACLIFEEDERQDYHYSGALAAKAELCVRKADYEAAIVCYEKTLKHLEMYTGTNTPQYQVVLENLRSIQKMQGGQNIAEPKKGLALCRAYFETYGKDMLSEKFPQYMDKITVGLVGEGSDCFGFDDEMSKDHDFGPRFCMWVSKEIYDEIGQELQKAYEKLPDTFEGVKRNMTNTGRFRQGVIVFSDFVEHLLLTTVLPKTDNDWLLLPESGLSAITNGEIWLEGDGEFTGIRKKLSRYPETVRRKKLLQSLHLVRQTGMYNYFRMKKRGEVIAAQLCLSEYMKEVMKCVYYFNNVYPTFYKWLHRGMDKLNRLAEVMDILNALYDHKDDDATVMGIMQVIDNLFDFEQSNDREFLIEDIVALEWEAFDKVENEGGRADCQDDYETFYIMRKSQYLTWPRELLDSFRQDLLVAREKGWNLITEKYARMMESTYKEEYQRIKDSLPPVSDEKKQVAEQIVSIQVGFMEEVAKEFPKVSGNARVIHTTEDTFFRTSYETYLRGELLTYSDETLKLYGQFIVVLAKNGENLARMIIENTAKLYGFNSLTEMENA